jgi:hypothetical protein
MTLGWCHLNFGDPSLSRDSRVLYSELYAWIPGKLKSVSGVPNHNEICYDNVPKKLVISWQNHNRRSS